MKLKTRDVISVVVLILIVVTGCLIALKYHDRKKELPDATSNRAAQIVGAVGAVGAAADAASRRRETMINRGP